jgi:hypothetical protein
MLKKANFDSIVKCEFGSTQIKNLILNDEGNKKSIIEKTHRKHMSLYIEASKPIMIK